MRSVFGKAYQTLISPATYYSLAHSPNKQFFIQNTQINFVEIQLSYNNKNIYII